MAIGGAFLGGGVEVVPAGSCKLELEILTEDRANLTATFTIKGTSTYTVTAGADGRAVYTVPAGQTYTVSVNTTGYDNLASQTVIAESGTVRYVRFEALSGRVKRTGDTMSGNLTVQNDSVRELTLKNTSISKNYEKYKQVGIINGNASDGVIGKIEILRNTPLGFLGSGVIISAYNSTGTQQALSIYSFDDGVNQEAYVQHPSWKVGTNDNSDKSLTIKMANSLPSLVHTTGNETIAGAKTFNNNLTAPDHILKSGVQPTPYIDFHYNNSDSFTTRLIQLDTDFRIVNTMPVILSTGTPSGATGTEIVTANWSIGKFLKKTGDTMTGMLGIQMNLPQVYLTNTTDDFTVPATEVNTTHYLAYLDKNGQDTFHISEYKYVGGRGVAITLRNKTTGEVKEANLGIIAEDSGSIYLTAPSWSPGSNDNSDKILTIKMANSLPSLVHTTGNESIAGFKTFLNGILLKSDGTKGINFSNGSGTEQGYLSMSDGNIWFKSNGGNITLEAPNGTTNAPTTPTDATGTEIATANWSLSKFQRKITYGTGDPPSGGQAGDIYIKI